MLFLALLMVFCYDSAMQSFDTKPSAFEAATQNDRFITVGRTEDIPAGRCARIGLSDGAELAIFNISGEFYAISNFCPHKGAPLSEGKLCGYTIECEWHGWEFDVRTGECLTVPDQVRRYAVRVEDGLVKVSI